MRIIGYTYEADVHCPACTARRFGGIKWMGDDDVHGVPERATDREGNAIHPVHDIDENDFTHCGDCREELQ